MTRLLCYLRPLLVALALLSFTVNSFRTPSEISSTRNTVRLSHIRLQSTRAAISFVDDRRKRIKVTNVVEARRPPSAEEMGILIDNAEFALLSYCSAHDIQRTLRRDRSDVRVVQRNLDAVGGSYSMIWYREKVSNEIHRVIAIPGSRNLKNMQTNMDNILEYDDLLKIKVHKGYRTVFRAILADFLREEKRIISQDIEWRTAAKPEAISLSVTGHSLGGAVACLLAEALQSRGYKIDHVTVFGAPRFTDKQGSIALGQSLNIERIEHVNDPAVLSPMHMPLPFSDKPYAPLEAKSMLLLEPSEESSAAQRAFTGVAGEPFPLPIGPGLVAPFPIGRGTSIGQLIRGVLRDPLSTLGGFTWRGDRIYEKPQRHKVYAGNEAVKRSGDIGGVLGLFRVGDMFSAHWQWHSMHAYLELMKDYQNELEKEKEENQQQQ